MVNLKKSHENKIVFNPSFIQHIFMVYILSTVTCLTPLGCILFLPLFQNFNQVYLSYFYIKYIPGTLIFFLVLLFHLKNILCVLGCIKHLDREFPGGPGVTILFFHCRGGKGVAQLRSLVR